MFLQQQTLVKGVDVFEWEFSVFGPGGMAPFAVHQEARFGGTGMQAHEKACGAVIARGNEDVAEDEGIGGQRGGVGADGRHYLALHFDSRSNLCMCLL